MARLAVVGLTLIEVLIALLVVSVAMTAIMWTLSHKIRSTEYLQNKMVAMLVGKQVLNEMRLGILEVPPASDAALSHTAMLGHDWYWQIEAEETSNKHIKKMKVRVFSHAPSSDEQAMLALAGYVNDAQS